MTENVPVPVYGEVPPEPLTVTVVEPPAHAMVPAEAEADNATGSETVADAVAVLPQPAVTVTVYVPADRPVMVEPVPPLLHA